MLRVMVCGGAGYIGSHMARLLAGQGHEVVVLDDLSTGHAQAVQWGRLVEADVLHPPSLEAAFAGQGFDAVFHFCARSLVAESVARPYDYYASNVVGTLNLLEAMRRHEVRRLVFSSSASVFGQPATGMVDEDHPTQPINPYGASKLMVERILSDAAAAYGLDSVALRYFNAAGATADARIGESHACETHLIPNVLRSVLGDGPALKVFGGDYPTPDGTCIRDYVHVEDLAQAHLLALDYLGAHPGAHAFNLGNGRGFSVCEVIAAASAVTGRAVPWEMAPRRAGDPAVLVASSRRARAELGWSPAWTSLEAIIESAWRWHRAQPW
ncbi:UDP-glucose 4-epimerase GalE [Stenotrophomonas sp. CW117]|uniref:UDP-glucose 4-epimerase GalE n=1 Tax=Stenotrophomonas TaxID=40323 RepID=UPI000702D932|nr:MULTISPECIES: UDP-glucose 4-epimerase GalE [Stenotrophomonas]KRG86342.1 UDP-galactose-4-epimerase [Stenotrophomonas acidaminiphila]QOF97835.1 UDP-glucose 4-epimerase GalE [Stenotrophomonas sp. CW117]